MIRFLALNIKHNKQNVIAKYGNAVLSSNNSRRLFARAVGSTILGVIAALTTGMGYGIFMTLLYFDLTSDCGFYRCSDYFQEISEAEPGIFHAERPHGNIAIAENTETRQAKFYVPSKNQKVTSAYKPTRKKPRALKFLDFKKSHPVLSTFENLGEPSVPQSTCPLIEAHEVLAVRGGFQKNTIRWQKIEEKIVLIIGFIALSLCRIIPDSNIDNYVITKSTNTKVVHLQNQTVFEDFGLEKISGEDKNDTSNIDRGSFQEKEKGKITIKLNHFEKTFDPLKYQVVKMGNSLLVHEILPTKDEQKIVQILEKDLHLTRKLDKSKPNKTIVRKKRQQVKKMSDLPPINFANENIIKTTYDINTVKIRTRI